MPLFGAHMSIAGGCHNALRIAQEHACDTVQLFTKNANQWVAKPLTDEEIDLFRQRLSDSGLRLPTAHDSYLINLASPDPALYQRSLEAFVVEMYRAEALGLSYLVMHPGSPTDGDEVAGLKRVTRALDEAHKRCAGFRLRVLLETTAGQGNCLGHRFEHLARLLETVKKPERLGVCFDTCHVFAAGYGLATATEYQVTMDEFDRVVGLDQLCCFHVNDSQKPQGSRVDRHAHLGRGCLGLEAFRLLVNDRRFQDVPMILETPKEDGDQDMDPVNLGVLRSLVRPAARRR
jgi:deoxyribonuclease-4